MHLEFLVEDSSGARAIEILLPSILTDRTNITWRIHKYKGIGRLPKGISSSTEASSRILLDQLPRILRGYGRTPGIDFVVLVVDCDQQDCRAFLEQLKIAHSIISPAPNVLIRLAIEEIEAWYLGDQPAILNAYPNADKGVLNSYTPDSICGTWEKLADAVVRGGAESVRKMGWPAAGELKHEWAERIAPEMDVNCNASPSFCKFRDGVRRITAT